MACKLVMTLLSESQEGECGEDWKYKLDVEVLSEGHKAGSGRISVPKHVLASGATAEPFGNPDPITVYEGECLTELLVKLKLTATEVDLFVNDVGTASMEFKLECPGPGASDVKKQVDITAGVQEAPRILNKHSVFTTRVRFDLICD